MAEVDPMSAAPMPLVDSVQALAAATVAMARPTVDVGEASSRLGIRV